LSLGAGWNLVSYLPHTDIAVADAVASIAPECQAVLGFHDGEACSYYPDLEPRFNDLKCLREHHGYWIKLSEPATLIYPETGICPPP
jgi:hypothetical protein